MLLRCALDHLAYQLVWVSTGVLPNSQVSFPIGDDRTGYIDLRRKRLKGARSAAIAAVDALAPYKGGNDLLWKLSKLNNVDKHRSLLTAGSAFQSFNVGPRLVRDMQQLWEKTSEPGKVPQIPPMDLFLRPADRLFPLKQGVRLFIDGPDAPVDPSIEFRFDLAFSEPGAGGGEPVQETLTAMVELVANLLPTFEVHLR